MLLLCSLFHLPVTNVVDVLDVYLYLIFVPTAIACNQCLIENVHKKIIKSMTQFQDNQMLQAAGLEALAILVGAGKYRPSMPGIVLGFANVANCVYFS